MQKIVLLFILSSIICVMHAGEWITLPQLQTIVGYVTEDDGNVVLNNSSKNYLFQKMRVTFSSNSSEAYSYIMIRYPENGNKALEFSFESWYSYRIGGIRWNDYFNKRGSSVSGQTNTKEYNLCVECNSSNDQYFYVSSWQKNFIPEQVQIYVEQAYYSIKFVDADGIQIGETQILEEGQSATPPTPPSREGYTFVGWIGTYTNVKSNATIYASYSRNDNLSTTQQGGLSGLFSVAPDKQVYFSQGNLQYMGATQTWRFAENQYDTIGIFNNNISSSYNGWIDLFGWGTSGWNSGAKEYQPYSTSTTNADYYPGNAYSNDLTGSYEDADWGIYNAIYNGGNKAGLWRTLTQDEWLYLYSERANADTKHAYATINGIGGYILLPDNWILPSGLTFDASGANANQYTKEQWKLMEQNGAVFLPAAGYREGLETRQVLKLGDYWLSTYYDADNACRVYFTSAKDPESYPKELRHYGFSVRLVGPAPSYKIAVNPSNDLMGSTSGSGTYNYGESVQISANPNDCFHFTKWSDGNTDNPRTIIVEGDATYTAIFEKDTYTITVEPADETQGTVTIELVDDTPSTQGIGTFSVSATKQVTFSPGNLQYHPANDEWRFAESQLDYIGKANSNCSSTYNGWLDLFGWSTSTTHFGVSTSNDRNDYRGSFVDWGTNQIGADAPNTWRTLTRNEWGYLLETRPNASSLCGVAQVNGVNSLILLPDNWTCPSGVTFKSGFHSSDGVEYYAAYQTFTAEQWSKLESAGAVFLPAAGHRSGSSVYDVQDYGYYWSATEYESFSAYYLYSRSNRANMGGASRFYGRSVRLVKDLR